MTTGQAVFASFWRSRWAAYLVALLLTGFTLLARLTVGSRLEGPTMIVFTIPVILSAYWGGMGSDLLATLPQGLGASYYILPPLYSFNVLSSTHRWQEAMLLLTGTVTSLICEALHRTHRRLKSNLVAIELTRDELKGSLKETKQAEEETRGLMNIIQQEKDRIASLLNSISDEVWFADTSKRFTLANPAARRELDLDPTERIGVEQLAERLEVSRPDGTLRPIEESPPLRALQGEIVRDTEEMIRDLVSGELRYRQVSSAPVRDASGTITGSVSVVRDITERKKTEAALRESADQFRTMANSIPQLAWMAHADGFIFWYTQRWHDYTGKTSEQMEGWGWQSVHDPDVLPKVLEGWRAAIANEQPFEMKFPLRGADGKFRMFLTRVQPMKDSQGRVLQWFGTNTDVEELKQMEQSLRDTQTRLNSTLLAGSIGTWTWDIVNDCLSADEFTSQMFSIETEAAAQGLPAEAYLRAIIDEDRPGVSSALEDAIQSCGNYDIEYRVQQKDGTLRWLQARGRVDCDAAGNGVSFHGAVMDITERKASQEDLRRSQQQLAGVIGSAMDAIITIDDEQRIVLFNGAAERMFLFPAEDAIGQPLERFIPERFRATHKGHVKDFGNTHVTRRSMGTLGALYGLRADGEEFPIEASISQIESDGRKLYTVILRDITERKRAEEALKEQARILDLAPVMIRDLSDP